MCFGTLAPLGGLRWSLGAVGASARMRIRGARAFSRQSVAQTQREDEQASMDAPFAFRGIPLGITLDEFRAGSTVRATPVGSVPVCETDMLAGALGMSLKTSESLTVACRWAHRTADRWQVSQAVVDGAPAQDHVLRLRGSTARARCVCTRFRS